MPKNIIVGTAGHIDHGKTALVRALTGIDADRLEEEKRRGITIDIGFAHLALGEDLRLGFIDVPGHERFVRNMLAGVGGIDFVMLTIAADESIMPQTREHFDICRLLGIQRGLVALTKIDLTDPEIAELVKLETEEYLQGSFLEGAPIIPVSSKTGEGIDQLRDTLAEISREIEAKDSRRHFRLPIDRVFVMKGFGTVVTGTLVSGALQTDSEAEVYPSGRRVRIRGLQVHGAEARRAVAGQRTAVNLSGVEVDELHRGQVLAAAGKFQTSRQIDCLLNLLPSAKALKFGAPVHFHTGAAELEARVFFLDRRPKLAAGENAYAQIRFRDPLLVLRGDRFIIRRFSPVVTIGGGEVLDNDAPKHHLSENWLPRLEALHRGDPERVLEVLVEPAAYGVGQNDIVSRTAWLDRQVEAAARALEEDGRLVRIQQTPLWLVHRERYEQAAERVLRTLADFHKQNPLLPGMPKEELRSGEFAGAPPFFLDALLAALAAKGRTAAEEELVRLAGHKVVLQHDEQQAREKIVATFLNAGLTVPALKELLPKLDIDGPRARKILQGLLRESVLVRVSDELVFHRDAIEPLKSLLRKRKAESEKISVPEFKDLAGVSRKYAIPLLEYMDRQKVTRRAGDGRVIL